MFLAFVQSSFEFEDKQRTSIFPRMNWIWPFLHCSNCYIDILAHYKLNTLFHVIRITNSPLQALATMLLTCGQRIDKGKSVTPVEFHANGVIG